MNLSTNLRDAKLARTAYWGKAVVRRRTSTLLALKFNPFGKHINLMGSSIDSSEHIHSFDEYIRVPVHKRADKHFYELRASGDILLGGEE
jgi:hypothetical protein